MALSREQKERLETLKKSRAEQSRVNQLKKEELAYQDGILAAKEKELELTTKLKKQAEDKIDSEKSSLDLSRKLTDQMQTEMGVANKQASLSKRMLDTMTAQVGTGDLTAKQHKDQAAIIQQIANGQMSVNDLKYAEQDLDENISNEFKEYLKNQRESIGLQEKHAAATEIGDDLFGGMVSKAKAFGKAMKANPGIAIVTVLIGLLKVFSDNLDKIGEKFGAIGVKEFSHDLMTADAEMAKLGYDTGTAGDMAEKLANEFGISFGEAIKMAPQIADMSKALGVSTDEGATLVGQLTKITGLSTESAIQFAKQTQLLAQAAGVAPGAVLEDIAASSESVAKFTSSSGENIAKAAIQAKKLGTDLNTVAGIAEGLLDFQSSIESEMEASVMIGRQLNFQRARELALNNDIEGAMSEIVSQVGSEAEFNAMNALQRDALAKSIGVSVDQMSKFVSNQDKAATLAERIADQPGFEELVGEEALSQLTLLMGNLKSLGATLTKVLGPPLNFIVGGFVAMIDASKAIGKFISENIVLFGALAIALLPVTLALLSMAAAAVWAGLSAVFAIPFVGPALGLALGFATVKALMDSVSGVELAEGGVVTKATKATVGEAGPEAVIPLDKLPSMIASGLAPGFEILRSEISTLRNDMHGYFGIGGTAIKGIGKSTISAMEMSAV